MTNGAPRTARLIGRVVVVASLVFVLIAIPRLASANPVIHVEPLSSTISVCDRRYRGHGPPQTLEAITTTGAPLVLVDPGPFGLIPSCPGPNAEGNRPCTDGADGPCATVVYVRVAENGFVAYGLSGGP